MTLCMAIDFPYVSPSVLHRDLTVKEKGRIPELGKVHDTTKDRPETSSFRFRQVG